MPSYVATKDWWQDVMSSSGLSPVRHYVTFYVLYAACFIDFSVLSLYKLVFCGGDYSPLLWDIICGMY